MILAHLKYLRRHESDSPFLVYHTIVMGSTDGVDWLSRPRDYELEIKRLKSQRVSTSEHPLRGTVVKTVQGSNVRATKNTSNNTTKPNNNTNSNPLDPLSSSDSFEGMDPLSMMARSETNSNNNNNNNSSRSKKSDTSQRFGDVEGYIDETFEPWSEKRADVLLKYTTSEKLTISTSFLTDNDKERIQVSGKNPYFYKVDCYYGFGLQGLKTGN